MADKITTLEFKLVIDGKEAVATLDVTKGAFVETGAEAAKANEIIKRAFESLSAEALKYGQVTEANANDLSKYISEQNISTNIIEQTIASLEKETSVLPVNSAAWKQKTIAATNLRAAYGQVITQTTSYNSANQQTIPGINQMRMAMNQFGYVLNDAQTFMISARMGLMGISNNLPMIVQLMQDARKAAGENASMMQLLTKSITRGGGLIIGINALLLLLNIIPGLFEKSSDGAEEFSHTLDELAKTNNIVTSGFEKLKKEIDNLSFAELSKKYKEMVAGISEQNEKLREELSIWEKFLSSLGGYSAWWNKILGLGPKKEDLDLLNEKKSAKEEIETIGSRVKYFLEKKYTAKELLSLSPNDRQEMNKYVKDILGEWPESIGNKSLSIGDKLKGVFIDLGTYSRSEVQKLTDTIDQLNKPKDKKEKPKPESISALASENREAEELIGKLQEIETLKNDQLSQYEKEKKILEDNYNAKIKGINAEIKVLKNKEDVEKEEALLQDLLNTKDYDYRKAWLNKEMPERNQYDNGVYHWASKTQTGEWLKSPNHPTSWKEIFIEMTGLDPDETGIKNIDEAEKYIQEKFPQLGTIKEKIPVEWELTVLSKNQETQFQEWLKSTPWFRELNKEINYKNLTKSDETKFQNISNLETQKLVEQGHFNIENEKLNNDHNKKMLDAEYKYTEERMKLTEAGEIKILELKKAYLNNIAAITNDPEDLKELERQVELTDLEIIKKKKENAKKLKEIGIKTTDDVYEQKRKELDNEEALTTERATAFGATEEMITNIHSYYSNMRQQIDDEEYQHKLDLLANQVNQISNSYNQIYDIIADGVRNEIDEWKESEEDKLEASRKAALSHANTSEQKEKINEEYDRKKEALDKEADRRAKERLEAWFNMQKALAIAEIGINLAKAIAVEWGDMGTLAIFTQGLIIAALTAQMAAVASKQFPKGYNEGGRLPAGKMGFFEGEKNEVVAPEDDFKTYSGELMRQALESNRYYLQFTAGSNNNNDLLKRIDTLNDRIEDLASRPVFSIVEDDAAEKIGDIWDRKKRTSR